MEIPVNMGGPTSVPMRSWRDCDRATGSSSAIEFVPRPHDDPAGGAPTHPGAQQLGWQPKVALSEGIAETVKWMRHHLPAHLLVEGERAARRSAVDPVR